MSKKKELQELKLLKNKLKSIFNRNQSFKNIFEDTSKERIIENKDGSVTRYDKDGKKRIFNKVPNITITLLNENVKEKENVVVFPVEEKRNIWSEISPELLKKLSNSDFFDKEVFDLENNTISIKTYFDLLDTVQTLINILWFDLTLSKNKNIDI
jgi:uncharacterized protein YrzB (UPF0473 family)